MRLRSIRLTNVRRFVGSVAIEGIGDGLNVLCEANEQGKSTIFDAVHALFFAPYRSRAAQVSALRPHSGGAPEVCVEVETAQGRFLIAKRWLSRPEVQVWQDGRLLAQADDAEAWLAALVGGEGDGGPSGLLWVRQGVSGLDDAVSPAQRQAALEARRDLLSSVAGEVEAMTGGRRMDAALRRCREELGTYLTPQGRTKARGPLDEAEQSVAALTARRAELESVARELHEALDRRRRVRRELDALEAPSAAKEMRERLEAAREAHDKATRHADQVSRAAGDADLARLKLEAADRELARLRGLRREQREAAVAEGQARRECEAVAEAARAAASELAEADTALRMASEGARRASEALRSALRQAAASEGRRRREELSARCAEADAARAEAEAAAAEAGFGPDAAALRRLDALQHEVATARALADAAAAHLVMSYDPGAEGGAAIGVETLGEGQRVPLRGEAVVSLRGLGRLTIRTGRGAADDTRLADAEAGLAAALLEVGAADMQAARAAGQRRAAAEARHRDATARLAVLAPKGVAALRAELAAIPEEASGDECPPPDEAQAAADVVEAAREDAERARETARHRADSARDLLARAEAAVAGAAERLRRAEAALHDEDPGAREALLEEERLALTERVKEAEAEHARLRETAPDLAAARATLARANSVVEAHVEESRRLTAERVRLDERIEMRSGEAVEEELADVTVRLEAAEARLGRLRFEVAALQRLEAALETARAEARDRYFAPVLAELRPLLRLLWPEAELRFDDATLLPSTLTREGREEAVEILSGGTQEQIVLLVRLAFARMLAASGRHAPVILDDALIYTDDERIERMFDALHRQAEELQIIVFSCRQRAFRDLGGHRLALTPAEPAQAAQ